MPTATATRPFKSSSAAARDPPPHKTRIVRRRGRGKDGIYSDDEIEREARSDSESDDSSLDSASDSETEPASEDVPSNGHPDVIIPTTADTPQPDGVQIAKVSQTTLWSEMVADEAANGTADLPVVDFADLGAETAALTRTKPARPRKAPKAAKKPPLARAASAPSPITAPSTSATPSEPPVAEPAPSPEPSTSQQPSEPPRRPGHTARQAYQDRLESDPSYVPTVGEFWSHDERLLDKDLRSLSGWWRGRWQGGPRGRGFGVRGRGRGGFFPPRNGPPPENEPAAPPPVEEVPPVERAWTHDGFEEMKKRDERRAASMEAQRGVRGGFRGARGGFVAGRGRGFARGGFSPGPGFSPRSGPPADSSSPTPRIWYAVKPERVWTKHHELFLYSDPALKPKPGQGPGYRVKLPGGKKDTVIRTAPRPWPPAPPRSPSPKPTTTDAPEATFTVKLPKRTPRVKIAEPEVSSSIPAPAPAAEPHPAMEDVATAPEPPMDDPFTLRQPPPPTVIPLPPPSSTKAPIASGSHSRSPSVYSGPPQASSTTADLPIAQPVPNGTDASWQPPDVQQENATSGEDARPAPPVLAPLQTSFSPTPSYGSPYGYAPGLPPGIALNQLGIPYELATGRAVYLQPSPAPMPVYTQPHVMPFVPHHVHHASHASLSGSPDFLHSPSPPVPAFGEPPIFAPPRQSSRIEIRRPGAEDAGKKSTSPRPPKPSKLRASIAAPEFHPQQPPAPVQQQATPPQEYYYGVPAPEQQPQVDMNGNVMPAYPAYQQQYYYPEQYGYAPGAYVEMPPQPVQYEAYGGADPRAPQPVYY
ncbi:hypothetical protein FA95DRAFT_1559874 [Auriscalpium vulgare]|uniref:Uncharacterized protein n=1 Tax=Auriscalpium vulgare TaxID=40419 RepID=A0ACB8RRM6_9AGAM|nr:hypothetical protein FA95DRAFT_1559874 [Auriscalpium vulgare]